MYFAIWGNMKTKLELIAVAFFVLLCLPLAYIRLIWVIFTNTERAWNILEAFDRVGNTALNGNPKETISSRAYRGVLENKEVWCVLCKILDDIQANHCKNSAGS